MRKISNHNGFTPLHTILAVLAVCLIVGTGWYVWQAKNKMDKTLANTSQGAGDAVKSAPSINSFEECKKAGYPIQESYPEACLTDDGKRFTNPSQEP